MFSQSFWAIYPIVISGLGFVCFKYPEQLRRLIYWAAGVALLAALFVLVHGNAAMAAYENSLQDVAHVQKVAVNPCDTSMVSFTSARQNDKVDMVESWILGSQLEEKVFIQDLANICIITVYNLVGLLLVTFLAVYIKKRRGDEVNNSSVNTTS